LFLRGSGLGPSANLDAAEKVGGVPPAKALSYRALVGEAGGRLNKPVMARL
jgi:hypothetical protein